MTKPITPERVQYWIDILDARAAEIECPLIYAVPIPDDELRALLAAYGRECGTCARFRITEPGRGSSWCDSKVSEARGRSVDATFGCNKHEVKDDPKVTR
jgi:hypothetical protein